MMWRIHSVNHQNVISAVVYCSLYVVVRGVNTLSQNWFVCISPNKRNSIIVTTPKSIGVDRNPIAVTNGTLH